MPEGYVPPVDTSGDGNKKETKQKQLILKMVIIRIKILMKNQLDLHQLWN